MNNKDRVAIQKELEAYRITWIPRNFHTGRLVLLKKLWDFLQAFVLVARLRVKNHVSVIFTFANVSAAMGVILKETFGFRMIVYSYEPHSEFLRELGYWKSASLKYQLLRSLEDSAGKRADVIMTGTKFMVERLMASGTKAKVFRAPTAVDENSFVYRPEARKIIRSRLRIEQKKVFVYAGKFGGLYYGVEIPNFFKYLLRKEPQSFFLILTLQDHQSVHQMFSTILKESVFKILSAGSRLEVASYLSAADMGIVAIPPSPAQRFRSPTKVAEYLLCGLPYITTRGVSEDDIVAEEHGVGAVVESFTEVSLDSAFPMIAQLLRDGPTLRERCRNVGLSYRSKRVIDDILRLTYYEWEQAPVTPNRQ